MNLYNEIEPYAAAWLANLSAAGHIANGQVEQRSIGELRADDVRGVTQFHAFAGIGVWSYALRLADWPDDVPVWTGSCPCQPFSAAGKGAGVADERHLWPEWFRLIEECRPPVVFGEQVASADGLGWLDAVHADLEGAGYSVGAADLCAAGVGAPHIRQRLFFVAYADSARAGRDSRAVPRAEAQGDPQRVEHGRQSHGVVDGGELADSAGVGLERRRSGKAGDGRDAAWVQPQRLCDVGSAGGGDSVRAREFVGDSDSQGLEGRIGVERAGELLAGPAGLGNWSGPDWVQCRDGKVRPVEPGTFPLAHGAPARVGRLRAYGNAIVPQVAATFIRAAMAAQWGGAS